MNPYLIASGVFTAYAGVRNFLIPRLDVKLKQYDRYHDLLSIHHANYIIIDRVSYWIDDPMGPPVFEVNHWYMRRVNLIVDTSTRQQPSAPAESSSSHQTPPQPPAAPV